MSENEFLYRAKTEMILSEWGEREKRIKLVLQPRPWWLPRFLWKRVVARLLVIQEWL